MKSSRFNVKNNRRLTPTRVHELACARIQSVAERWNADRFADVILPDGETREVRVAKDTSSSARDAAAETPTRGFPRYRARPTRPRRLERVSSALPRRRRRRGPGSPSRCIRACRSSSPSRATSPGRSGRVALAVELKAAADRGEPDDGSPYYNHWVATLERLVTAKGLARLSRARRSQGGVGRRLSSHAARQTGGAPANGLNASIDEDL